MRHALQLVPFALLILIGAYVYQQMASQQHPVLAASGAPNTLKQRILVRVHAISPAARLVTAVVDEEIEIQKVDETWRGDATATIRAPLKLLFGVDLNQIGPKDILWDPKTRLLVVRVPNLELTAVDYDLKEVDVRVDVTWTRTKAMAGQWLTDLAKREIHSVGTELARDPKILAKARKLTIPTVRAQLEKVLSAVVEGARVDVTFRK